jgi:hypothetical protein
MIPMKTALDKSRAKGGSRPRSFGQAIARNKPKDSLDTGSTPDQRDDNTMARPAAGYLEGSNTVTSDNHDMDGGADSGGNTNQMEDGNGGRKNIPQMKGKRGFGANLARPGAGKSGNTGKMAQ